MTTSEEIENEYNGITATMEKQQQSLDDLFSETHDKIMIDSRPLKQCIAEQPDLHLQWSLLNSEISSTERRARDLMERVYATVYRNHMGNSYKSLTATDGKMLSVADDNYVRVKQLHNNTQRLRDDCESVFNIVKSRQYSLKDISNILVSGVEDHII